MVWELPTIAHLTCRYTLTLLGKERSVNTDSLIDDGLHLFFFFFLLLQVFKEVGPSWPPPHNHTPPPPSLLPLLTHISFCMWLFQRRQKPCVSAVDLTSFASRVPPLYALVSLESSMNRSAAFILLVVSTSARLAASQLPLSAGLTRADAGPNISEVSGKTKN